MTLAPNTELAAQVAAAAHAAGLQISSHAPATGFSGVATTRFQLALATHTGSTTQLEISQSFKAADAELAPQLAIFLAETSKRLQTPVPNGMLTLGGLPLTFSNFEWPFHESTAGADTSLVHGQVNLADTEASPLHAKVAAAMTVTFRDIVRAPEQPFAESFILNAVRKTFDQGQLELVKSGNRQPVPVTTRYFSPRQNKFIFNDTTEPQRRHFLAAKAFWFSGQLGNGSPVWMLDPRDAQYLNATVAELKISLGTLVQEGLVKLSADADFATPTPALMAHAVEFQDELAQAMTFIKPTFNEEMRSGHTNM